MSARGQEFLDNWIEEFVATGQSQSADLASIAIEEAADEGIGEDELRETAGGDLDAYISGKLTSLRAEEDEDTQDPAEGPKT